MDTTSTTRSRSPSDGQVIHLDQHRRSRPTEDAMRRRSMANHPTAALRRAREAGGLQRP